MNPSSPEQYCHSVIHRVSRTFAIGIERMDEPLSSYVCVSYLMCRIPDTIEDASHLTPRTKQTLLDEYARLLDPSASVADVEEFRSRTDQYDHPNEYWDLISNTDKVWSLWSTFPDTVKEITRPYIGEMVDGMKNVVGEHPDGIRLKTMDQFKRYCYYVAGTVGNLLTGLFEYTNSLPESVTRRLFDHAEDFGEALQTVNIVKDVYVDYHRENTIYLPQERLIAHGGSHSTLFERPEPTEKVLGELIEHARKKLLRARSYITLLPPEAGQPREFCIIPYLLAVSTLREATRNREDLLTERPVKIDRQEVMAILSHLPRCLKNDQYLVDLVETARREAVRPPTHDGEESDLEGASNSTEDS